MNWKLASLGLLVAGLSIVSVAGCAADAGAEDDGAAEEAGSSQDELNANAQKLVGAFHGEGSVHPPSFQGLVFKADGTFLADIDTGIRCVRAPCPSNERLTGTYTATKSYVRLNAGPNSQPSASYGRFRYTLSANGKLSLSRSDWKGWSESLDKETSYCAQPTDCDGQAIMHPMCVGSWTCGANQCGYKCGAVQPPVFPVWPSDATKLVSKGSGGGFTPPPPAGSQCGLGQFTFTLDVASKSLAWETCKLVNWQTPLTKQSGQKTLSAAQMAKVVAAMDDVTVTTRDNCGADKPMLGISVTSASGGTKTYKDSFYACQGNGTYVDGIDALNAVLDDVAGLN